jgi:hypothetical protein
MAQIGHAQSWLDQAKTAARRAPILATDING